MFSLCAGPLAFQRRFAPFCGRYCIRMSSHQFSNTQRKKMDKRFARFFLLCFCSEKQPTRRSKLSGCNLGETGSKPEANYEPNNQVIFVSYLGWRCSEYTGTNTHICHKVGTEIRTVLRKGSGCTKVCFIPVTLQNVCQLVRIHFYWLINWGTPVKQVSSRRRFSFLHRPLSVCPFFRLSLVTEKHKVSTKSSILIWKRTHCYKALTLDTLSINVK